MFKRGNYRGSSRNINPSRGRRPARPSRSFRGGQNIDPSRFIYKAEPVAEMKAYASKHKFADFAISPELKRNIATKGYTATTPIQDQAIPVILAGSDVVGIANTGTGKTAAFLIPLINKVLLDKTERVLIVVPTRELAVQINEEFRTFRGLMRVFSVCCVGGASIGQQISHLRHEYNFLIGTPGRLKDLVERGAIKLSTFGTIVLDEADRMLDMGFVNDMRFIMSQMAAERQTLLFSATIKPELDKLIHEFLKQPVKISVKTGDTSKNIDQDIVRVKPGQEKIEVLHNLLIQSHFSKVLIFGRTKHGVERLSLELIKRGFKAEAIHGNKNQNKRQRALKQFDDNHSQILVATDVAARGLDIDNVSHVINYDLPATYEDYVHRIGRTGRGNKTGKALTFV